MLENKIEKIPCDTKDNKQIIKFNIPENYECYLSGNGEGCFGYIEDEETYNKYDKDDGQYNVILMHGCWEYPILEKGTVCLVEARTGHRPVVNWEWLQNEIREDYCADIIECLQEDDDVEISLEYNQEYKGFDLTVKYSNDCTLIDFIVDEEVNDCLEYNIKNEPNEEHTFDSTLLACVGWRIDKFREDNYYANWLEDEEGE